MISMLNLMLSSVLNCNEQPNNSSEYHYHSDNDDEDNAVQVDEVEGNEETLKKIKEHLDNSFKKIILILEFIFLANYWIELKEPLENIIIVIILNMILMAVLGGLISINLENWELYQMKRKWWCC